MRGERERGESEKERDREEGERGGRERERERERVRDPSSIIIQIYTIKSVVNFYIFYQLQLIQLTMNELANESYMQLIMTEFDREGY